MSRPFAIRPATATDRPAILELMNSGLGSATRARSEAFWQWKHERQPFGRSIVFVAEAAGGELIGLRAFMRWRFRDPGRSDEAEWRAVRAVDTVTDPAYRRRGVFAALNETALAAAREDRVDFVFNTPNDQSAAGYLKQGWIEAARLPIYLRPVRLLDLAGAGFRYLRNSERAAARQWLPTGLPAMTEDDADSLATPPVAEKSSPEGMLETCTTPSFHRWRYCSHPHVDYYKIPTGEVSAPLVLRPNMRFGAKELVVCSAPRGAPRDVAATVRPLLRASGASYCVAHSHSRHPSGDLLAACGFRRVPFAAPRLLVRPLSERARRRSLTRAADWAFETGDLEVF